MVEYSHKNKTDMSDKPGRTGKPDESASQQDRKPYHDLHLQKNEDPGRFKEKLQRNN